VEKTAEMTFAEALSSVDQKQEKLAAALNDLPVDELEELLKKEAPPSPKKEKSSMVKMSAEEKFALADQWGRDLARDFAKTAANNEREEAIGRAIKKDPWQKALTGAITGLSGIYGGASGHGLAAMKGMGTKGKALGAAGGALVGAGLGYGGSKLTDWTSKKLVSHLPEKFISKRYQRRIGEEVKAGKEKKSLALPPGVSGLLGKAMPTVTKGLQSAGKAMGGTSMLGRAAGGAALGALGGAAQKPGVNPMTGQSSSRLGGALRGAAVGGVAGAAAPAVVGGAQKLVGRMAPAVGK
jgi:hypothetical protein